MDVLGRDVLGDPNLIPPPTHINDTHKKWDVFVCVLILFLAAAFTTIARLYVRWKDRTFGLDDWAMVPALLFFIGHSILACYVNANAGIGKPLWEVTMPEFELWAKGTLLSCFLYPLASGFIRISILLFYDRVFSKANHAMKIAVRVSIAAVIVYMIAFLIWPGFLCKPLHKFWKAFERERYCGSNVNYWKYNAVTYGISLLFDLELLILPIIPVMRLQLSRKKRWGALAMFLLGTSACVAATYKTAVFGVQWNRTGHIDPRWFMTQASRVIPPQFDKYGRTMWIPTQAELSAALIGSSMIALKPYLKSSVQKFQTALGTVKTPYGSNGSGASEQRSADAAPSRLGGDHYMKMGSESKTALHEDFELRSVRVSK